MLHVEEHVQRVAHQNVNEPNRTTKLHNADMQFVALRALEAVLDVIQDGGSAGTTVVLPAPGWHDGGVARQPGHVGAQT